MWPTMVGFALVVWLGYGPEHGAQSLDFMGMALLGSMALGGLVVVALLGIIKGVGVAGTGRHDRRHHTTADDPDVDPGTRRGRDGDDNDRHGFGRHRDRRGGRPMPSVSV